jgi:hypothetical protein
MKIIFRFAAFFLFAAFLTLPTSTAADKPIVIVHARLIDGLGGAPLEDATVVIRGKTIEYAGPAAGAAVPSDAQIIDAFGKTVMPGLADLHVHLQGAWDGTSVDLLGYQRYLNAMLYAGVTTLMDTGNYQPCFRGLAGLSALFECHALCRRHYFDGHGKLPALDFAIAAGASCGTSSSSPHLLRWRHGRFRRPSLAGFGICID